MTSTSPDLVMNCASPIDHGICRSAVTGFGPNKFRTYRGDVVKFAAGVEPYVWEKSEDTTWPNTFDTVEEAMAARFVVAGFFNGWSGELVVCKNTKTGEIGHTHVDHLVKDKCCWPPSTAIGFPFSCAAQSLRFLISKIFLRGAPC